VIKMLVQRLALQAVSFVSTAGNGFLMLKTGEESIAADWNAAGVQRS
jgi:hypothetical protein